MPSTTEARNYDALLTDVQMGTPGAREFARQKLLHLLHDNVEWAVEAMLEGLAKKARHIVELKAAERAALRDLYQRN